MDARALGARHGGIGAGAGRLAARQPLNRLGALTDVRDALDLIGVSAAGGRQPRVRPTEEGCPESGCSTTASGDCFQTPGENPVHGEGEPLPCFGFGRTLNSGGTPLSDTALRYPQRMTTISNRPASINCVSSCVRSVRLSGAVCSSSSDTTLAHLHTILQICLGWSDEHLHTFHIHGKDYGSNGADPHVRLRPFVSVAVSASGMCMTLAPTGNATSVSKRCCR